MEQAVKDFILTFTSILYEALPFIILGAVIAGILEEFLPQRLITRILPRSRFLAVGIGGLLGLVFPMCECGIIPVMRRLLRKGLPLSCCVAYMLAGPIINGVVMLSTYVAFSGRLSGPAEAGWMVGLRVGMAYLIAVTTAMIVDRLHRKHGNALLTPLASPGDRGAVEKEEGEEKRRPLFKRLSNISETALHDFVDITVFLCLGALLSATVRVVVLQQMFGQDPHAVIGSFSQAYPAVAILAMMGFAIVLCLCSEADAFVAASFTTLAPSAKLAFLVLGPMMDIKLYLMYTRVFRPRLIWTIIVAVVVQVFLYCLLVHWLWYNNSFGWFSVWKQGGN